MKRQAFTPLAGPPQKRMMLRPQGGGEQWHDQGGTDPMQQDAPQQHKAHAQIPALGSNATPLGSGNNNNAGSNPNAPGVPHRAKLAAPKGPVFVLADAQALIYVIMDYVAKQNKPGRGREAGYDLCKFKSDFVEAFK